MFQEKINDYFEGASAKYLSAVDAEPDASNQHEIGGLVRAGFDKYLGRPPKGRKTTFKARMAYLRDGDESPIACEDTVSWYDARHEGRSPEYRLYYKSNDVTAAISEGDFFLIGKLHDGSLALLFAPKDSTAELQLRAIFGITSVKSTFEAAPLSASDLLLPLRLILEEIGLSLNHPPINEETWLEKILSRFGDDGFPKTAEFSEFSRETIEADIDPISKPDECLLDWMNHEENLFRILERHIVRNQLINGFGKNGDDVDVFVEFSLSVQNRRKSRVGRAFENHISRILEDNSIIFEQGGGKNFTENKSNPDFIFPSFSAYKDPEFPIASLRLLGAKTTCKDRWRQVLSEGSRIPKKHLITLEAAISESQTAEMEASGLNLIVPTAIHPTYTKKQQEWLISVKGFIEELKFIQSN